MKFGKLEIKFSGLESNEEEYVKRIESNLEPLKAFEFKEPLNFDLKVKRRYERDVIEKEFQDSITMPKEFPYGLPSEWEYRVSNEKHIYYLKHYDSYLELEKNKKSIKLSIEKIPPYTLRLIINDSLYPLLNAHSLYSSSFSEKKSAYLIIGNKNSGKTTLLLSALDNGFNHVSDDTNFIDNELNVYPYNPDSMVWSRQIKRFGLVRNNKWGYQKNPYGKYLVNLDNRYSLETKPKRISGVIVANINSKGIYNIKDVNLQNFISNAILKDRIWLKPFLDKFDITKWYEDEMLFWKKADLQCYMIDFDFNISKIQNLIEKVVDNL